MGMTMNARLKPIMAWLNRLSGWLLLLAVVWLSWAVARLLWLMLAPPQAPILPVTPLQPAATAPLDYASSFMIFEQPDALTESTKPPPNINLKGVMLATPEQYSAALLEVDGVVRNYRVGEQLINSTYKVIAVSWNQAILADPSDKQIVITLLQPMSLDQGQVVANNPAGPISNQPLPVNNNRLDAETMFDAEEVAPPSRNEGRSENNNPQLAISEAVEELKQNPASYLSRMGVMATGEGYQVTDAMPDKLKNRLGLEPGDKVLTVNGQNVGSNPAQDAGLLDQVKQSGEAQIEVQRGDQVITIRQQF